MTLHVMPPTETFNTLDDVLKWCGSIARIPATMVEAFLSRQAGDAEGAFDCAITLREMLYRLLLAIAQRRDGIITANPVRNNCVGVPFRPDPLWAGAMVH